MRLLPISNAFLKSKKSYLNYFDKKDILARDFEFHNKSKDILKYY